MFLTQVAGGGWFRSCFERKGRSLKPHLANAWGGVRGCDVEAFQNMFLEGEGGHIETLNWPGDGTLELGNCAAADVELPMRHLWLHRGWGFLSLGCSLRDVEGPI